MVQVQIYTRVVVVVVVFKGRKGSTILSEGPSTSTVKFLASDNKKMKELYPFFKGRPIEKYSQVGD